MVLLNEAFRYKLKILAKVVGDGLILLVKLSLVEILLLYQERLGFFDVVGRLLDP